MADVVEGGNDVDAVLAEIGVCDCSDHGRWYFIPGNDEMGGSRYDEGELA